MINPVLRAVLRSRLHRLVSKNLMILHVTGRRSGQVYDVPVGRHQYQDKLVTSAGGRWK